MPLNYLFTEALQKLHDLHWQTVASPLEAARLPKPTRSGRGNEAEPFAAPLLSKPEEANGNLRGGAWIFTVIARFPTPILKT
jgi:hypothetical protein